MYEEPVLEVGVIVVRLWWEEAGAGDVALRARVTSTVSDGPAGSTSAASTIDGIVDAVRAGVDRFLASRPPGTESPTGSGHG
ncbi:MAG TPA: hypothetical protein VKY26_07320 [Actinomycetota bacterium]|nr:hypothetical protein [Actinomycetota bacterium]